MKKIIKKAKITKGKTVEVSLVEVLDDNTERDVIMKCDQLCHGDLERAFDKLKAHLACICDQKESDQIENTDEISESLLDHYNVTQFIVSGAIDTEGAEIIGTRRNGDKILNLVSPFVMYSDDDYKFTEQLALDISACIFEVEQYLFNNKVRFEQKEIEFPSPDSGEFQANANEVGAAVLSIVAKNLEPKKGRGKSKKMIEAFSSDEASVYAEQSQESF